MRHEKSRARAGDKVEAAVASCSLVIMLSVAVGPPQTMTGRVKIRSELGTQFKAAITQHKFNHKI